MEQLAQGLQLQLAINLHGPDDSDPVLLEAWRDGLIEGLRSDVVCLLDVIGDLLAGENPIIVEEADAMQLLRAASAMRLRLKELYLASVSDALLEAGDVDFHQLEPERQQAYAAYLLLAALQEQLIAQIDPESGHPGLAECD